MSNGEGNRVTRAIKESQAWRSLFRQPYPTTSRTRALAVMNNVFLHLHPVRVKRHAVRYTYTFCLGGISFFLFLALTVTGLYLMFFYVPSISRAYQDIQAIEASVAFGSFVRNMHRWAAHLMVLTVFLHMIRVFYHGAYKPPREFNWVIGILLLFFTLALSFSGYLLPWDQIAFWAITVGYPDGDLLPGRLAGNDLHAARRHPGRPEHAAALLRGARDPLPAAGRHPDDRPLLEDPEGRRHLRAGVG